MRRTISQLRSGVSSIARGSVMTLLATGIALSGMVPPAAAQQRYYYERRSLLDMLFGRREPDYQQMEPGPQPVPRRIQKPKKRVVATPPPSAPSSIVQVQPDTPPPVQKLDTAKTILVVGDFLASGLGDGLESAFEASPGVVITTRGTVASGLVRRDYYDWQQQLPQMIADVKPAMVVVMIGANDRQQIVDDVLKEKFGTDVWYMAYEQRVQAFAKEVTGRNIPLVWVGLPSFQSPSMTSDAIKLNRLYRNQVEGAGGQYVDIWDGFTDEDGKFIVTGSDVNGQQVRLRTADGVNLTESGRRKVAFYVEKSIRHLLGDQASPDISRLDADKMAPAPDLPPSEVNQPLRTQPISLSDPDLDGGAELLGGSAPAVASLKSPRDLLVEKGEMAPPPAGRVDDYRLPEIPPAP